MALDTDATADGLGRAVEKFAAGIDPHDIFVFFAADCTNLCTAPLATFTGSACACTMRLRE
jgi:hypothetical protein